MRKPLAAILALAVTVIVGVAALVIHGATSRTDVAQTLGVAPAGPVADLGAHQEVCQRPISIADRFQRVQFFPTIAKRPGPTPAIGVLVRDVDSQTLLGHGSVPAGFSPTQPQTVTVGDVPANHRVALCFFNRGPRHVQILGDSLSGRFCTPTGATASPYPVGCSYGWARPTISTSFAILPGAKTALDGDLAVNFLREPPRSLLTRLPLMIQRASLFKPSFAGPGLWWALIALWLIGAPVGVAFALRRAARDDAA